MGVGLGVGLGVGFGVGFGVGLALGESVFWGEVFAVPATFEVPLFLASNVLFLAVKVGIVPFSIS